MSVKKQWLKLSRHRAWAIYTFLWIIPLCMLMFRGGGSLYWGPLESDLTNQFYPWRVFLDRWLQQGVFPFWDPHIFSGYPTIETQQMLNLNPFHLLSMLIPPHIGLTAFTALNTLIAAASMGWGLRRWGRCSWMAASLGAGLYVFGALFAVRVMAGHLTVVTAMAWWPLAALSVLGLVRALPAVNQHEKSFKQELASAHAAGGKLLCCKRLRRLVVVSAIAHAMVCLAGAPQYIVYLFYIDMAILIAATRRWAWGSSLATVAMVWIIALLLSAPQWLPTLWYLPYTGRATSSSSMTGFTLGGIENIGLEMLMPFPFGDDIHRGHLHFKNVWETATYPGTMALLFALALVMKSALWLIRRIARRPAFIAPLSPLSPLSAAGVVIFMFGIYMMAGGWLPGFSGFREPQKARALLAFSFAVMSAGAFDSLLRNYARWRVPLAGAAIMIILALALAFRFTDPNAFQALINSFGSPMDPLASPYYSQVLENPAAAARLYQLSWFWACAGLVILALLVALRRRQPAMALSILFFASLADPFLAHTRAWVARHPWERADLPEPVKDYFAPRLEANKGQIPYRVILHSSIINRTHHLDGLYEYHGYDPLMPAYAVGRMFVSGVTELGGDQREAIRDELISRVGVRYDTSAWFGTTPIDAATTVILAPRATLFTVARKVVSGRPENGMFGPALDGTHYVLPKSPGVSQSDQPPPVSADFEKRISQLANIAPETTATSHLLPGETITHLTTGRPDEYGVYTDLTQPALILYKGTWLPGWRVRINGTDKGPALFANNWMCAAIVPAGRHEVVFQYRPVAWWPSWGLTVVGLLFIYIGIASPKALKQDSLG